MKALGYSVNTNDLCPSIEFCTGKVVPELSNPGHGRVEVTDHAITIDLAGNDFGILLPFEPVQARDVSEIWISIRGNTGEHFSLYWRDANSDFSEERSIKVNYVPGEHWRVVRFEASKHPLWKGTIQQLRIDMFNGRLRQTKGLGQVRWARLIC
jgi:hypothetical protein